MPCDELMEHCRVIAGVEMKTLYAKTPDDETGVFSLTPHTFLGKAHFLHKEAKRCSNLAAMREFNHEQYTHYVMRPIFTRKLKKLLNC